MNDELETSSWFYYATFAVQKHSSSHIYVATAGLSSHSMCIPGVSPVWGQNQKAHHLFPLELGFEIWNWKKYKCTDVKIILYEVCNMYRSYIGTFIPVVWGFKNRFLQGTFHQSQLEQSNFLSVVLLCHSQSLLKVPKKGSGKAYIINTDLKHGQIIQVTTYVRRNASWMCAGAFEPPQAFQLSLILLSDFALLIIKLCL